MRFGDISLLSAIGPGFQRGAGLQADIAAQREHAAQLRLQTQDMMDERAALAALGNAFGMAPPGTPPPQGPGQPSLPAPPLVSTSGGGAASPPLPPGAQYGAPSGAGPTPAPQAGPLALMSTSGGAPITPPAGSAPPPQPGAPQLQAPPVPPGAVQSPPPQQPRPPQVPPEVLALQGQMSTEQLAQRIIRTNPGIEKRPDLLVRAMAKGQALLAPDAKATLTVLQLQQKIDAAAQKLDIAQMQDQTKRDLATQLDAMKERIAQLQQAGADARAAANLQEKLDALQKQLTSKEKIAGENIESKEKIAFAGNASKEKIAQQKVLAQKELSAGKELSPQSLTFYAQALRAGNLQAVNEVLGMSKNRAGIMDQIVKEAQAQDPEFDGTKITSAMLKFGGQKAAAGVVGRTAGGVAVGAEELPQYMPQIEGAIKTVNTSKYPTINSILQAYDKGVGDPEVVFLRNMVQGARNAYQQIAARGGRMTVFGAQQAQELISGNMPVGQFAGAARALIKEAEINKGATGAAMDTVTNVDVSGTMVTDARKVAALRAAGDSKAYEEARDKYLERYKAHGGEAALRDALKKGPEAPAQDLPMKDGKVDPSALEEGQSYTVGDRVLWWDGTHFVDQKPER